MIKTIRGLEMNSNIMKALGFDKEVKLMEEGKCPSCEKVIDGSEFKNQLSREEYRISGLCQKCQDKVFFK